MWHPWTTWWMAGGALPTCPVHASGCASKQYARFMLCCRCDAKLALPRGTTSTTVSATSPLPAGSTHRIFVARIPPTVTDPEFKSYWETFGPVQVRPAVLIAAKLLALCTHLE